MPYRDDLEALRMLRDRIAGDLEDARRSEREARQLAQRAAELEDELAEVDERLAMQRAWSAPPPRLECRRARPLQVVALIALVHGLVALGAMMGRVHQMSVSAYIPVQPSELSLDERLFHLETPRPAPTACGATSCDPLYFLDSDGNPRVKPECLVELPAESAMH